MSWKEELEALRSRWIGFEYYDLNYIWRGYWYYGVRRITAVRVRLVFKPEVYAIDQIYLGSVQPSWHEGADKTYWEEPDGRFLNPYFYPPAVVLEALKEKQSQAAAEAERLRAQGNDLWPELVKQADGWLRAAAEIEAMPEAFFVGRIERPPRGLDFDETSFTRARKSSRRRA